MKNVINYSTRDYTTALAQMNSDSVLKEQPTFLKTFMAGILDVISNTLNAVANALVLRSAYDRPILQNTLQLIDYQLSWKNTSSCIATLTIDASATSGGSYTIPVSQLKFSTVGTVTKDALQFESRSAVTFSISTTTTSITLYQQETQTQKTIGTTDGTNWQQFELPDIDIISDTLAITINSVTYTKVNTFGGQSSTAKVYKLFYRTNGSAYIVLGGIDSVSSSQFGFIPAVGLSVFADCAIGGGAISNTAINTVTEYVGSDSNILTINNDTAATGGRDEETIQNAIAVAPIRARSCELFTNESSGVALAKGVTGVQSVQIKKSGTLAVDVWIIPIGGGTPSTPLKNTVQSLLESAAPLEDITVNMLNPSYIPIIINVDIKPLSGFDTSLITRCSKLALAQRTSEIGEYIFDIYNSSGIEQAVTEINSYYNAVTGITYTESDYAPIEKILKNISFQTIGEDLKINDLVGCLVFVDGIDYVVINSPSNDTTIPNGSNSQVSSLAVGII